MAHSTFIPDPNVVDGMIVVLVEGAIFWAGPVQFTPMEILPEGAHLHANPNQIERIRAAADRREPGGIGTVN